MLLLTSTSDQIRVVTDVISAIDVHATWIDLKTSDSTVTPGRTNTAITTAATTSVAGSPGTSLSRNVRTLHIRNKSTNAPCVVIVQHSDGTKVAELYSLVLQPGIMLEYTDQGGFLVIGA